MRRSDALVYVLGACLLAAASFALDLTATTPGLAVLIAGMVALTVLPDVLRRLRGARPRRPER